jgi:hypothetical protein
MATDVLNVDEFIRVKLVRNGSTLYEQVHDPAEESYTVHAADRLVLAANMGSFQQANLGDIDGTPAGQHLIVVADRAITIAVNTTAKEVVADTLILIGASISALYFKNTDVNNTATVEFVVTD